MFNTTAYSGTKEDNYQLVMKQLQALIHGEKDEVANLANASALLNQFLDNVNWVGFYLLKDGELVLGPFQGLPACLRIGIGRGVCGTAFKENRTVRVDDVDQFPGHIACDAASKSEIVTPIYKNGEIYGVLDIDSPIHERFDEIDEKYIELFANTLSEHFSS